MEKTTHTQEEEEEFDESLLEECEKALDKKLVAAPT
jgi:hypothetical protein